MSREKSQAAHGRRDRGDPPGLRRSDLGVGKRAIEETGTIDFAVVVRAGPTRRDLQGARL